MKYSVASVETLKSVRSDSVKTSEKSSGDEKPVWFRLVATAIFVVSLSFCIRQSRDLLLFYQSDPITTQLKMEINEVMNFPAVTLCNMNPVRRSRWNNKIQEIKRKELVHNRTRRDTFQEAFHLHRKRRQKRVQDDLQELRGTVHLLQLLSDANSKKIRELDQQAEQDRDARKVREDKLNAELENIREDMRDMQGAIGEYESFLKALNTTVEELKIKMSAVELTSSEVYLEMENTKNYLNFLKMNMSKLDEVDVSKNETTVVEEEGEVKLPPSKDMEAFNDYIKNIGKMNRSDIDEIGHQRQDFIALCSWQGTICNPSHFNAFQNIIYGNCYTFNTSLVDGNVRGTGPRNGLSLSLYIEQNEYIDRVAPAAGARIVIHDSDQKPFPGDEGFSVAPGYTSAVFLKKTTTETVKPMCDPDIEAPQNEDGGEKYQYSQKACLRQCLSDEIFRQCHCVGMQFFLESNRTCAPENKSEEQCVQRLENLAQKNELSCSCPISCRTSTYNPMISSAIWPADKYLPSFLEELVGVQHKVLDLLENVTDVSSYFRKQFLRIDIFFQELTEQMIIQRHSYGLESLFSDIGGQLGLWIGVSVATFYETAETFCVAVASVFRWLRAKMSRKKYHPRVATPPEIEIVQA